MTTECCINYEVTKHRVYNRLLKSLIGDYSAITTNVYISIKAYRSPPPSPRALREFQTDWEICCELKSREIRSHQREIQRPIQIPTSLIANLADMTGKEPVIFLTHHLRTGAKFEGLGR